MHLNNDPRKKLSTSLSPPQSLGKNKGVSMPREKTRIEAHKKQHLFYYSLISFSIFLRLSFDLYRLPYPNSIHITPIITRYTCNTFTHHATTLVTHSFHSTYHHRPPSNIHIPSNDKKLLLLSHPLSSFFLLSSSTRTWPFRPRRIFGSRSFQAGSVSRTTHACACACSKERERERVRRRKTGAAVGRRTLTRSRCCPLCSHRCFLSRNALSNFLPSSSSTTRSSTSFFPRLAVSSACAIRFVRACKYFRSIVFVCLPIESRGCSRKPLFGYIPVLPG